MEIIKDIGIIGAGPAGMSAALYLKRSKYSFELIEKENPGGKLNITTRIENYPGVGNIDGFVLAKQMRDQLKENGIMITIDNVLDISEEEGDYFKIIGENNTYFFKILVIATGSTNKKINVLNEDKFIGKGISYCAVCDGFLYRNKDVCVFANSRKGYSEAIYLSNIVNNLYLVNDADNDDFEGNLADLKEKDNVIYYPFSKIKEFNGDEYLSGVTIINEDEEILLDVDAVFPFFGDIPSNYIAKKLNLEMNNGYIVVDKNMRSSLDRVYAIGDIVEKPLRQIVTACSDGAIASTNIIKYLNSIK